MTMTAMDMVKAAKADIKEISLTEARQMLQSGSIALDVREQVEFDAGHVPGSFHISRGTLEFMIGTHPEFEDKARSIIVYCKSGGRSALATATLQKMGYSNVYSMAGGFDAWSEGSTVPPEIVA